MDNILHGACPAYMGKSIQSKHFDKDVDKENCTMLSSLGIWKEYYFVFTRNKRESLSVYPGLIKSSSAKAMRM